MLALKLDSAFWPLELIDSIEALVLCIIGKAMAIETYETDIRSARQSFKLPAVIVLKRYVKYHFNNLSPNRVNILWRDNHKCQYCGNNFPDPQLTMDHVIPKSRGGQNTWDNLVTACKKCNQKKGSRLLNECKMSLLRTPCKPKPTVLRRVKKGNINDLWKHYLWEKT
jgi:5-methylcytosine-specific restriction endonuclease McrA